MNTFIKCVGEHWIVKGDLHWGESINSNWREWEVKNISTSKGNFGGRANNPIVHCSIVFINKDLQRFKPEYFPKGIKEEIDDSPSSAFLVDVLF